MQLMASTRMWLEKKLPMLCFWHANRAMLLQAAWIRRSPARAAHAVAGILLLLLAVTVATAATMATPMTTMPTMDAIARAMLVGVEAIAPKTSVATTPTAVAMELQTT